MPLDRSTLLRAGSVVALSAAGGLLAASGVQWLENLLWITVALAVVVSVAALHGRRGQPEMLPWALTGVGLGVVCLGHAPVLAASSSWVPLVGVAGYCALAAAIAAFHRDRSVRDWAGLLDALVVTVAAALAGWTALLSPLLGDTGLTLRDVVLGAAYPLASLVLLASLSRLSFALTGRTERALHLLAGGVVIGLVGDVAAWLTGTGELAVGWFVAAALVAIAAQADRGPVRRSPGSAPTSLWRFVALLGLACLVPPTVVLTHPMHGGVTEPLVVLGGAVLLFVLALMRMGNLLGQLRRSSRRERVLREATGAFVQATDRAAVRDAALTSSLALLDLPTARAWRIDGDPGGTIAQATDDDDVSTFLDAAELAVIPDHTGGIEVVHGPTLLHATLAVPSTQDLIVIGLPTRGPAREAALVAVPSDLALETVGALHSLASTMALALERLDVGQILVERRSERRLRLMLQYASDVICILDHDLTVVHVTPAVEPLLGLPAPELLGLDWLDVVSPQDRDTARELVGLARGGRPVRGELRLLAEDGRERLLDTVVTEVVDEDLSGFVVTCHDITDRHELEQQLTHQAFHDALTGLANRALFRDRLGHAMARARGAGGYGVLFLDLDDFKTVNDSLGHAAGDRLLRETTERIRSVLREGDTAARLGGDEFAVLLEDIDSSNGCEEIAGRLLEVLQDSMDIDGTEVTTSASIGIVIGQQRQTPEELMRNADLALYEAKTAGKGRYAVFAPAMHDAAIARLSLTSELRHALDRRELVVHYQPLVSLGDAEITGLEALVRWEHPTRGLLAPGLFIPLAEETGLIIPLGKWVLREALRTTVSWQQRHPEYATLRIAVNVSGRQLQDPDFVEVVREALRDTGIEADTVVLEITETILLPGDGIITERLDELAALGVHLYIDDFGTGYSSLSYLQQLPVDGIKLAQEFVEALPGTGTEAGLVRTIRDLATTLGLDAVVAEGIERPEQWTSLLSLGYELGQGFHLAMPMPAASVDELLAAAKPPVPQPPVEAARS